jgi:hypothetical protein
MMIDPSSAVQALQAMAKAGASDRLLGEAVRELLAGRPAATPQSSNPAGAAPAPEPAAPLRPPSAQKPSPPNTAAPAGAGARRAPSEKKQSEIVVFKSRAGTRSSVSVSGTDWVKVMKHANGDPSAARTLIRQAAGQAPAGVNRSHWAVEDILSGPRATPL